MGNVMSSIHLIRMFFGHGRKPDYLHRRRENMQFPYRKNPDQTHMEFEPLEFEAQWEALPSHSKCI